MFRYICKDLVKFFRTVFDDIFVLFPDEFNLVLQEEVQVKGKEKVH